MKEYKFRKNVDIGNMEAENDPLLLKAFVEKYDYQVLKSNDNTKSILLGRTGAGKTAMIRYLEENESNVSRISPEEISLTFLSNSDILNYFREVGVSLDVFYKVLWKHIFMVQLLKIHFGDNYDLAQGFFDGIFQRVKDNKGYKKRKEALEYLKTFEKEFWDKTENYIVGMTRNLQTNYMDQITLGVPIFESFIKLGYIDNNLVSEEERIQIVNKSKNIVAKESQVDKIFQVEEILKSEIFTNPQKRHYIIIDDLDKNWVDKKIVYDLIRALIIAVGEIGSKFSGVKVIISLRNNILQKVFEKSLSRGTQTEKYEGLLLKLSWTNEELKEMLDKRLEVLMRGHYSSESPSINDIMPEGGKRKLSGLNYMLERSFNRPRDIIAYFNKCIEASDGNTKISRDALEKAEIGYSKSRLKALKEEWLENYGDISPLFDLFKNRKNGFTLSELTELDLVNSKVCNEESIDTYYSPISGWVKEYVKEMKIGIFKRRIAALLFNIGLIGVKLSSQDSKKFIFEHEDDPIDEDDVSESTKVYVHPMFHSALKTG